MERLTILAAPSIIPGRIDQLVGHFALGSRGKRLPAHDRDLVAGTTAPRADLLILTRPGSRGTGADTLWHVAHHGMRYPARE